MRISLIQTVLSWESPAKNYLRLEGVLQKLEATDLIVLPEMFTTGFTMNSDAAEFFSDSSETLSWMRKWSKDLNAVLCGSVAFKDNEGLYNRLLWVRPDGTFSHYDKRHLFTFAGEEKTYLKGTARIIEHWKGWNICPLVCYDLRFPVWSRNRHQHGSPDYDVLIYVANWPSVRREAWSTLLKARAIENQCYVAGVNRVGTDHKENIYTGDSAMIDAKGTVLWTQSDVAGVCTIELNKSELDLYREQFPVLKDGDEFVISKQ
jgi:omega-amidase